MIHTYEIQDQDEIVVVTPYGNVRIYSVGQPDDALISVDVDDAPTTTEVRMFKDGVVQV